MATAMAAAGAKDVTMPTYAAAKAEFDALLLARPAVVDSERAALKRALGLAS